MSLRAVCFGCLLAATPLGGWANSSEFAAQRPLFKAVLAAIDQRDALRVAGLTLALGDYPLIDYLHYRWLRERLRDGEQLDTQIRDYLTYYPGKYAERLRGVWAQQLAEQQRWRSLLLVVRPETSDSQRCLAYRARFAYGQRPSWEPPLSELWSRVGGLPKACDDVMQVLVATAPPGEELVWKRVASAIDKGRLQTAKQMATYLPEPDQRLLDLWILAERKPRAALQQTLLDKDTPLTRRIFMHAVKRLSQDDAELARGAWLARRGKYSLGEQEIARVDRYVAVRAALQRHAQAPQWLRSLSASARNSQAYTWRARADLYAGDWRRLRASVLAMPAELRTDERWRYWLARADDELGNRDAAQRAYNEFAERTNYYGFLAADRIDKDYRINDRRTVVASDVLTDLQNRDAAIRAREFLAVGLPVEARREWQTLLNGLDEQGRLAAALLADGWGWHDRAVYTIAGTRQRNDYALRFPMPFDQHIDAAARIFSVEPALIYGVLRRESAYREDARSRAGALGLMQLMPSTAQGVAKKLGTQVSNGDLLRPDVNIRLGTWYFRDMLDRFSDHQVLAAAAYNAGPRRVRKWLPDSGSLPADVWVETLPFKETRGYVQAVMAYTTIFDWRRGGVDIVRLRERMPEVAAP
ncbi:MAG: lytic transglycosylase domain-containing protein [Gammaproteobacteria bacterium]|nr:lytic transglycosylase domain-containing protein [Gammaproteobacteria bacterium]